MANAIITVIGEVRNDRSSSFTDPESAEVRSKRRVEVLTRGGFLEVSIPANRALPEFEAPYGQQVVWEVEVLPWSFRGKNGTSFIFDRDAELTGIAAALTSGGSE